jgi:uncharacterized protein
MIIYSKSRDEFTRDVLGNQIDVQILDTFKARTGHRVGESEVRSWRNSLVAINNVFTSAKLVGDSTVSVEYKIPQTSKRIDVIVSGQSESRQDVAVIVELKQWEKAQATDRDAIVETFIGRGIRETLHPSYQAWTYAALLEDFCEPVREDNILLAPCAYLHNCVTPGPLRDPFYSHHTDKAPIFLKADARDLGAFIKQHVHYGDKNQIMYRIENGKISPSKNLADKLASLLDGNPEFLMIDDQKLVFEKALRLAEKAVGGRKQVFLVEGGPGTGKSVVAVNLLVELIGQGKLTQYVTKNGAPRAVYEAKLTGSMKKSHISNLFTGSGAFTKVKPNTYHSLVIDEAHRLNAKSGLYQNEGENQIKELIGSAQTTIFFIDEAQRVTFSDIGTKREIRRWAKELGADLHEGKLESQFRCNGSDGYLAWATNALQVGKTANTVLNENGPEYDFGVCETPNELFALINTKNNLGGHARLVAGYCWKWASKKDKAAYDICFDEHDFKMQWNFFSDGGAWILKDSVHQIGCIHTCQGLDLDYVGVIIGPDFVVRNGIVQTDGLKRAVYDRSIRGFKKQLKEDRETALKRVDEVIKKTYFTLMTRGQKGCYIWCTDPETNEYFKSLVKPYSGEAPAEEQAPALPFKVIEPPELKPFVNAVPVYSIRASAGELSAEQIPNECHWVALPEAFAPQEGYFVLQVVGDSMNKRIPNGAWCLFKKAGAGSREGKIVLAEYTEHNDADHGGQYTVKRYHSTKQSSGDGDWEHSSIVLKPESHFDSYREVHIPPDHAGSFRIIGELVAVLEV